MLSNIILTASKVTTDAIDSSGAKDVLSGFDAGLGIVKYILWQVLDKTSIILGIILVGVIAFTICRSGFKIEDMHAQWTEHMFKIIFLLIFTGLLFSFSFWGDKMIGGHIPKDPEKESKQITASIEYSDNFNYPKVG